MAIKVKVFMWEGTVNSVVTDSNEEVEVEFIDAYTKGGYGDMESCSDEAAAEQYEEECRANGFHDVKSYEIGSYKDPEEDEDDEEDEDEEPEGDDIFSLLEEE